MSTLPDTRTSSRSASSRSPARSSPSTGYHGAKLAEIAARAGLTHPTLLYHFNSKEDLYAAVIAAR